MTRNNEDKELQARAQVPGEAFSGKLIICPTPIGNLGDMTERTLAALRGADVVCAEDIEGIERH